MLQRRLFHTAAIFIMVALLMVLAGCGKNDEEIGGNEPETPRDPITLSVFQSNLNISDTEFEKMMKEPTEMKYPHITLELVRASAQNTPENLVVAGTMPDMIFTSGVGGFTNFMRLESLQDLSGLIRDYPGVVDTSRFDPVALNHIASHSSSGQLYALPFSINFSVMYYNKELFDRFGVSYPWDGMKWEETIALARQMTRLEDGKQYAGFDSLGVDRYGGQMSLPFLHPETLRSALNTDGWKRAFEVFKAFKDIPGNNRNVNFLDAFLRNRDLSMIVAYGAVVGMLEELHNEGIPMDWDIVTIPEFTETPGTAWAIDVHVLSVSATTPHKEDAFKVISLLTNDLDIQKKMTAAGRLTSLNEKSVLEAFGANLNSLPGKNIEAVFKNSAAPRAPNSVYNTHVTSKIVPAFNRVVSGTVDINTALREADEQANRDIAAEIAR